MSVTEVVCRNFGRAPLAPVGYEDDGRGCKAQASAYGEKPLNLLARARSALPDFRQILVWSVALVIGAFGGAIAQLIGTPLPWLLGSMLSVGAAMGSGLMVAGRPLDFPEPLRKVFIAVIGIAIGASAGPDMIAELGQWWRSLVMV